MQSPFHSSWDSQDSPWQHLPGSQRADGYRPLFSQRRTGRTVSCSSNDLETLIEAVVLLPHLGLIIGAPDASRIEARVEGGGADGFPS